VLSRVWRSTPPDAFIALPYSGRFHETAARAFGDSQSEQNFCEGLVADMKKNVLASRA
jgi:hypothetical protein